jgi:AcrR family transcriptional regulator
MSIHLSKEERTRQLLDAAIRCFGEKGYHATQVSDIIEAAEVARGTFYLYFKSKREIFDVIMMELFRTVHAQIKSLPRDAVDQIPSQIMGNIRRVTHLLMEKPFLAKLLMNEAVGLDAEQDARLREFYDQILDYIRRGLKQGQEMGFVRAGSIQVLAISLLGVVKEIFYQSFLGTSKPTEDEIAREIYQIVVGAVAHPFLRPELEKQVDSLRSSVA